MGGVWFAYGRVCLREECVSAGVVCLWGGCVVRVCAYGRVCLWV